MDAATLVRHALEALKRPLTLKEALSSVADFRIDRKKKYPLYEILMVAVCAMIDGAKGPTSGALRAKCPSSRQSAIQRPAGSGRGRSHHWPLRCWLLVAGALRPQAAQWLRSATDVTGDIISIDGKLLRRALTKDCRMPCIVSAHSSRTKLVTGQVKADEKSNEITAIPALLDLLYLKGAIVTIDAAGCQKKIVRKIMRRGAGYVISLKGNLEASLRSEVPQPPTASNPAPNGRQTRPPSLAAGYWLLVTGCWLLEHFGRRPSQSLHGRVRRVRQKHRERPAALRAKCSSNQQPVSSVQWRTSVHPLHCPLCCWLLVTGTLRPQAAEGKAGGPCGEPRHAQARRAERAAARQVGVRRNQREAKGAHMGRRQAAEPHARGVGGRRNRQATDSNPRGLDARAFAEETGALENCAWNTS